MFKFGLEKEYFVQKDGEWVLATRRCVSQDDQGYALPQDECGYLAEARGEAHPNPLSARYLFQMEEDKLVKQAAKHGLLLFDQPFAALPPALRREAARRYGKNPQPAGRGNLYGKDYRATDRLCRAGLHVHFSNTRIVGNHERVFEPMDMPRIIRHFDNAFAVEIKEARRIPGMYEMKPHGFEYRSLPANTDLDKVVTTLKALAV